MSKSAKRAGPDPVAPIVVGGLRFEVPHWGRNVGEQQNGGFLAACDSTTGERLWVVRVYEALYDARREKDVQDVFIVNVALGNSAEELLIEDEEGRRYRLEIPTRTITAIT